MKLLRACLLLSLLVGHLSCVWAASIVLDEHPRGLLLNDTGQLLWLADYSGALTLDDVRGTEHAARFVPLPAQRRHGEDVRPHWFKVELEQRAASGDWVLATQTTALKDVRFHGPFDAAGRALAPPVHTGLAQPYATRPLGSERYLMRLQLPGPGTYTVYVRLQGEATAILGLSVWDTAEYLQWRQHKRLFDGICYGILLALLVYNLVLAGIFRDATYGFYIGQCAFALLTLASFNGHAAHYLWGHWPWWQERGNVVLPGIWLIFGMLFARSFLDTRRLPGLDRLLLALGLLAALAALLGLGGQFSAAQTLNEIVSSAGALLAAVAAIIMLRRGFKPAQWYLGGQALLFLSVLGVVLVNWNVIDAPFLLANGLQIGVAAEMVVFAIALSRRISGLRTSQTALRLHAAHLAEAAATDPLRPGQPLRPGAKIDADAGRRRCACADAARPGSLQAHQRHAWARRRRRGAARRGRTAAGCRARGRHRGPSGWRRIRDPAGPPVARRPAGGTGPGPGGRCAAAGRFSGPGAHRGRQHGHCAQPAGRPHADRTDAQRRPGHVPGQAVGQRPRLLVRA